MSFAHLLSNAAYRLMVWEYALQDLLIPRYDALDMFHAVRDPAAWLRVIHRIVKSTGRLILEDGHQSRASTVAKVSGSSELWRISGESRLAVTCVPVSRRPNVSRRPGRRPSR